MRVAEGVTIMSGALDGIRIIDMTSVGMGPMATQMLGDMGADVIKLESKEGDVFRHVLPQRNPGMSHAHLNLNRNKRSVVLDAKTDEGVSLLKKLIGSADIFISNMRAPAMRRLGIDADTLLQEFPRLIHCSCYGYSEKGPYAGRAAIDDTIQAAAGVAWLQGAAGKESPRFVNSVIADKVVALYVTQAITAALYARSITNIGQAIEVPMFECMVSFMCVEHLAGRTFEPKVGEAGYARLLNEYRRPFKTKDGYMSVVPYTAAQWRRFFELTGHPELVDDIRFKTAEARSGHYDLLYQYVQEVLVTRTNADWTTLLISADIPFSPVNSIDDLLKDPHLKKINFWRSVEHPTEGNLIQAGLPIYFSKTPSSVQRHAPNLGEHTDDFMPKH
jgi:crotonobetainyl-CoA:carnitine CoA-transferase CaiB-like acyl-CoA transferase